MKIKLIVIFALFVGVGLCFLVLFRLGPNKYADNGNVPDSLFGWKYPSVKFPITGPGQIAYSNIRDPGGVPQGLPVRLKIPIISVDAAIEDALITSDGRMDVPEGSTNVAWFSLGPHPGREGSAVIGGHFGIKNGVKFVFYDLDKLKIGDKIYIENDKGDTLAFQVRSVKLFDRDADATDVFTSYDKMAHLNLITCEGVWNKVNGTYPQRRVVFTDAVLEEGAITVMSEANAIFERRLGIGSRGADVVMLQTALEEQKFLTIPRGVTRGYFGVLTSAAVIQYQKNVGLPPDGVFGRLARAKLFPEVGVDEPSPTVIKPTLPSTALESPDSISSFRALLRFMENLYATPLDGLITSFLLISIIFIIFKITRRQL
ncbi:MAG: sortase [Patescibacteria group bacterium]|nr:sortase [Patescibacteria group bacterium]